MLVVSVVRYHLNSGAATALAFKCSAMHVRFETTLISLSIGLRYVSHFSTDVSLMIFRCEMGLFLNASHSKALEFASNLAIILEKSVTILLRLLATILSSFGLMGFTRSHWTFVAAPQLRSGTNSYYACGGIHQPSQNLELQQPSRFCSIFIFYPLRAKCQHTNSIIHLQDVPITLAY